MQCQPIVLLLDTLWFTVSRVLGEHRCALENGDMAASAIAEHVCFQPTTGGSV